MRGLATAIFLCGAWLVCTMTDYLLPKHVYLCVHDNEVVFLDLKEDKYLAIDAAKASQLLRLTPCTSPSGELNAETDKVARALLKRGLLTTDPAAGKEVAPVTNDPPTSDFHNAPAEKAPRVRVRDVFRFLIATATAWMLLRGMSLEKAVTRVRQRKQAHAAAARPLDLSAARHRMAIFERIRPFVFSARDACLFESLTLIEFLARYDLYPAWVFGVHVSPFGAHCWVQHASIVLNDSAEHACGFTPILVV